MRRGKNQTSTVPSPCVRVCRLENNTCTGCARTKDEISQWLSMNDEQRLAVLNRIANV